MSRQFPDPQLKKQPLQTIIFITATDTGVGKTVLTALLLSHLRQSGHLALALKPFCSGGREDAELLYALQNGDLSLDEINPFYFSEPLAPLVAARKHDLKISASSVIGHIKSVTRRFDSPDFNVQSSKLTLRNPDFESGFTVQSSARPSTFHPQPSTLLIEGAGGLLSPLCEPNSRPQFKIQGSRFKVQSSNIYTALDLIAALRCQVLLVAPNRLGVINHALLTINTLQTQNVREIRVVLMECDCPSASRITHHASHTNPSILTELLSPIPLFRIPYLGKNPSKPDRIQTFAKKCKKTLAQILS